MEHNLFIDRHIGPDEAQQAQMLSILGYASLKEFIQAVVPAGLISQSGTTNAQPQTEDQAQGQLKQIAAKNIQYKNYIGMGYYDTVTPSVIRRNVFENPGWYTAYTPYQAEISQGRLEALLNFQQMVMDLTGFALANASLLDEATAAAEAMLMARRIVSGSSSNKYFVDAATFPQTIDVIKTRAQYQQIEVVVGDVSNIDVEEYFGVLIQNPNVYGKVTDYSELIGGFKQRNPLCIISMACDILSLVLFKSPCHMGADIAIGSTQRFGIPIGFGGPSAAYLATHDVYRRLIPGRIIGVSVDSRGKKVLRMALQTREQHIRREKATSNICTSQVLLANMAGFYAVYHGSKGLKHIATHIHQLALMLVFNLIKYKISLLNTVESIFDTITVQTPNSASLHKKLEQHGYLVGLLNGNLLISLGERSTIEDMHSIFVLLTDEKISKLEFTQNANMPQLTNNYSKIYRTDDILTHEVFSRYHSETKMMRYLKWLENKDISLVHSMIPLGSCTMKLNAACQLEGVSWDSFANIHPFTPAILAGGYIELINGLSEQLKGITGFAAISMQPNSGAQGEFAGLLSIRRYNDSIGQSQRNICLIPRSAHGTNPATAQLIGLEVVVVNCDANGNVDIADLKLKATQYKDNLACLMITYPSTHGVFEMAIKDICTIVHDCGGQVYMDGANLNAMVGLLKPAELGVDVSHINLHKTFAIPHGGGGPGMGPIGVRSHLVPFLPGHMTLDQCYNKTNTYGAVSAAKFGSASILLISWMYITLLGERGLRKATQIAILNANYVATRLKPYYPILYIGQNNTVAHECIIDLRLIKQEVGITEVDIAKRLMDYGFHSPTMSFPVPGTLMIEPTESEDKLELDRFIEAMIHIHSEIEQILLGQLDRINNPLKNAPHTVADLIDWNKPYTAEVGCFPMPELKTNKIFPTVNRIDDAHGDRNFICNCFAFDD